MFPPRPLLAVCWANKLKDTWHVAGLVLAHGGPLAPWHPSCISPSPSHKSLGLGFPGSQGIRLLCCVSAFEHRGLILPTRGLRRRDHSWRGGREELGRAVRSHGQSHFSTSGPGDLLCWEGGHGFSEGRSCCCWGARLLTALRWCSWTQHAKQCPSAWHYPTILHPRASWIVPHHLFMFAPRRPQALKLLRKTSSRENKADRTWRSGGGERGHVRQKPPQGQPARPHCFFFGGGSPFGASVSARHFVDNDPYNVPLFRGHQSLLHSQAGRKWTFENGPSPAPSSFRREWVSVPLTESAHAWRWCFLVKWLFWA